MGVLETRDLRYFTALAEELHFGRAARRVGIAQPPLSRAIRQLERRLGVTLVDRSGRRITLTAAGLVLYEEAKSVLDAVEAAERRTRSAAQQDVVLRLAMKPGGDADLLKDILSAFGDEPGAVPVQVRVCGVGEHTSLIRRGDADVALMHRKGGDDRDLTGIEVVELLAERQVVLLPRDHRLARRRSVNMSDLEGETMPHWPGEPEDAGNGPEVRDAGQLMQLVALGETLAVVPASVRWHLRHDLVCVPVVDAEDSNLLLGWLANRRSVAVSTFVRIATTIADRRAAATTMSGEPCGGGPSVHPSTASR